MLRIAGKNKNRIAEICFRYGVSILLLFGSQVTGGTHRESDADLAYFGPRRLSFEEGAKFNSDLQNLFGSTPVQTVDLRKAPPLLLKKIMDDHAPLLLADKHAYFQMQSYAVKNYLETKFLRDYAREYLDAKYAAS